jgi:IS5 family transposase
MWRSAGNRPLTKAAITRNKIISRLGFTVEQGFGTLKRRYRFDRARYLGLIKIEMEFHLNAMAFNPSLRPLPGRHDQCPRIG